MYNPQKFLKIVEPQIRKMCTISTRSRHSHYDALGISPKATQADIKSAYYKLSMVYHPDKNEDSEDAANKFRAITEAYEILSNVKTRKLYDRGLSIDNIGSFSEDIPLKKFYRSRETKSRPVSAYGRTGVYDFDEWSKSHYGDTFQRDMRFKKQEKYRAMEKEQNVQEVKSEKVILLIGILFLCAAYLFKNRDFDATDKVTVIGGHIVVTPKSDQ